MTSSTSRRNPRAPTFGPLSTVRTTVNGVDFGMVRVPSGRFVDGEGPTRRELLVSRPFELGVAPVTQALWRAVMGWNASRSEGEDRPVEMVSWEDSQAFMAELERQGFPGFRLPTEAEWAWAARCGAPTRWVGADRPRAVAATVGVGQTVAVAGLPGSPVGAFDLSGNVREWVGDWHEGLGLSLAGVDLQGPASGRARVHRGGSWTGFARFARISFRDSNAPAVHGNSIGLRLSRTVQDQG
jgi:formylglycine-generating enzyme required for sulfatase activity